MKPDRGGRPPRDNKIRGVIAVRAGVLAQEIARELMFVDLLILKTMNVEKVIAKYRSRVRSVSWGENWRTRIIQPRWAIEE